MRGTSQEREPYNEMWVEFYSAHPCALTLHFHTSPFILKLAPGAEKEDVNIFNLIRFLKSELICYLKAVRAWGITSFLPRVVSFTGY